MLVDDIVVAGAATVAGQRRPSPDTTTETVLALAFHRALESAGLHADDVDGLGVASFGLRPDRTVDLAWKLGLRLRWTMDDVVGINQLQHAVRAIQAGDASVIVIVAGDCLVGGDFGELAAGFNRTARDYLNALPTGGPNALFALITQAHMQAYGLTREAYGRVAITQRKWAARNPDAVYRTPLTMSEYLEAPLVSDPLGMFDCVPVVAGADAIVVTSRGYRSDHDRSVRVRSVQTSFNHDNQESDGLSTGLAGVASRLWSESNLGPADIDLACVYDDYPVMVLIQLQDLGFIVDGDARALLGDSDGSRPCVNTSGGMLSAGQAGAGGGLHGLVECVRQLRGERGEGQVANARTAVASSSTVALYRVSACSAAVVLERDGS